jgi:NAD dependent epimerase/dehydratase family enzyme
VCVFVFFEDLKVLRIPPVLSNAGGAFPKMRLPASLGAAATFGSGQQIFPWIHEIDLANAIVDALFSAKWKGVVNVVAPEAEQTSAQQFTAAMCSALNRPYLMPNIPEFATRLMLGGMKIIVVVVFAHSVHEGVADFVLHGKKISNSQLVQLGFKYQFPTLQSALQHLTKE